MVKAKLDYHLKRGIVEDLLMGIEPEIVAEIYNVRVSSVLSRKKKIDKGQLDLNILEANELFNASARAKKQALRMSPITKSPHPTLSKLKSSY